MSPEPAAAASEDGVRLETFTDEELAVLCGPGGIVVTPFLGTVDAAERTAVERTAYRSLLARGVLDPPTLEALAAAKATDSGTAAVAMSVRHDVHALVTLRTAAQGVIAVARTTSESQDFWYAHLVDDVVLMEIVDAAGLHAFRLGTEDALADLVAAACIHPGVVDGHGDPVTVALGPNPEPPKELLRRLGDAFVRADLVARAPADSAPELLGIFSGPGGAWLLRAAFGSGEQVLARPVPVAEVRAAIDEQVTGVLARTVRSESTAGAGSSP